MKRMKRNILSLIGIGALAMVLSSCSLFGGGKGTVKNTSLPQDREVISNRHEVKTYTPEELKNGVVKGDWAIESVYGHPVVGEQVPFIKFVPSEKKIYGNNGCNVINADYTCVPSDSIMRFDHIASTMMMCSKQGLTDYEINTALGAAHYYTWRIVDTDYYITLLDESGRQLMEMMHQNFEFLNGTWSVTRLNDNKINVEGMKLVIDIDEGKLHGNTGCNILNGNVEIDMDQPNSISFSSIGITRMMCPDNKYETGFVVALEEVSAARPVSGSEVILYNSQHKPVLTLVRTTDK